MINTRALLSVFVLNLVLRHYAAHMIKIPIRGRTAEEKSHLMRRIRKHCLKSENRFQNSDNKYSYRENFCKAQLSTYNSDMMYGTINVGNPSSEIKVSFDTTSPALLVPSECDVLMDGCPCRQHSRYTQYKPIVSAFSFKMNGTFRYIDRKGIFSGKRVRDSIEIGNITIKNVIFGQIKKVKSKEYHRTYVDGIFGLARYMVDNFQSPVYAMEKQQVIDKMKVSIFLNESTINPTSGNIYFGKVPAMYLGNLITHQVMNDNPLWMIDIKSCLVGRELFCNIHDCKALFDSASPYIYANKKIADQINRGLGASLVNTSFSHLEQTWTVPCDTNMDEVPDFNVNIEMLTARIRGKHLIRKIFFGEEVICATLIRYYDAKMITLGIPFFLSYFTVFDYAENKISFARAKF